MYAFHFFFSLASPCCIVSAQLCEEWIPIEKKTAENLQSENSVVKEKATPNDNKIFLSVLCCPSYLVCVLMLVLQCFSFYSTPHKLNRMQNFKSILYSSSNLLAFCQVDQRFSPQKQLIVLNNMFHQKSKLMKLNLAVSKN